MDFTNRFSNPRLCKSSLAVLINNQHVLSGDPLSNRPPLPTEVRLILRSALETGRTVTLPLVYLIMTMLANLDQTS
jgi:hypothetical protein